MIVYPHFTLSAHPLQGEVFAIAKTSKTIGADKIDRFFPTFLAYAP
jgi:hypothetical protein